MVVRLSPEAELRLQKLAATTGRCPEDLIEDAMTGYLAELSQVRDMLDIRYDDLHSHRVQPIDGNWFSVGCGIRAKLVAIRKPHMLAIRHAPPAVS